MFRFFNKIPKITFPLLIIRKKIDNQISEYTHVDAAIQDLEKESENLILNIETVKKSINNLKNNKVIRISKSEEIKNEYQPIKYESK